MWLKRCTFCYTVRHPGFWVHQVDQVDQVDRVDQVDQVDQLNKIAAPRHDWQCARYGFDKESNS